jgi:serine/threonine protein kinase
MRVGAISAGSTWTALCAWRQAATAAGILHALFAMARELFARFHGDPRGCTVIRDLKPENLVLAGGGRIVRLIDVAAARREGEIHSARHLAGVLGTGRRPYRPPEELLRPRERFDRRLDYFAFGATAFFVLTGRPPYDNREADPGQVMATYVAQYAQALPELSAAAQRAGVAGATLEFLIACLHPQIERRPSEFPDEDGW